MVEVEGCVGEQTERKRDRQTETGDNPFVYIFINT